MSANTGRTYGNTSPASMTDAINCAILSQLNSIHTAMPATIVSYDYLTRKARIQPLINKQYTNGFTEPLPELTSVPVIFPYASGASITFPVNPGDTCLVIFCERSLDQWLTTGIQAPPDDPRKFDLSDGVAIMGLLSFNNSNPAPNNTDLLISYKGSEIKIQQNGQVTINAPKVAIGNSTTELLDVLSTLMTYLQGAAVTGLTLGGPLNPAFTTLVSTLQTKLATITGAIP